MATAFVSYVRENHDLVDRLVNELRRAGVTVWLDRDSITPGVAWERAIAEAIECGGYFLACFSHEGNERKHSYMIEELTLAFQIASKRGFDPPWLIPLVLTPCEIPNYAINGEYTLRSIQMVNLTTDWHEGMRQLLNLIEPRRSFGQRRQNRKIEAPRIAKIAESPLLALDFGTSYSSLAIYTKEAGWKSIPDEAGRTLIPSVITFTENWDYDVGWEAVAAAVHAPERSVANVKRWLGSNNDLTVGHKQFDPETLASLIIRALKENAERFLGLPVSRTLVAIPANFSQRQSSALARACVHAGLEVVRIIGEPIAGGLAAQEWCMRNPHIFSTMKNMYPLVLVVDIGGGTTDISLVDICRDDDGDFTVNVIATSGDNELGGMDYDAALFNLVKTRDVEPRVQAGMSWTATDDFRLQNEIRRAKSLFNESESVNLIIGETESPTGMGLLQSKVTRHEARKAFSALDARIESLLEQIATRARRSGDTEPNVLFLGGQGAKMFTVRAMLAKRFPKLPLIDDHQEHAVVLGLGVYTGVLGNGQPSSVLIYSVPRASCP